MFERFTDRARTVMAFASIEARRLGHEYVGTEHMLLGLVREETGVAAHVLKGLGVGPEAMRKEIERITMAGSAEIPPSNSSLPLTPRAKSTLEYAVEEARALGHSYVGTEHQLLGLLREEVGIAAQVLMNLGINLNQVRAEVVQIVGHNVKPHLSPPRCPSAAGQLISKDALLAFRAALALSENGYIWLIDRLRERRPMP
jgi:ATP-dependent Clp protease ATP-binding subunit ClpC